MRAEVDSYVKQLAQCKAFHWAPQTPAMTSTEYLLCAEQNAGLWWGQGGGGLRRDLEDLVRPHRGGGVSAGTGREERRQVCGGVGPRLHL